MELSPISWIGSHLYCYGPTAWVTSDFISVQFGTMVITSKLSKHALPIKCFVMAMDNSRISSITVPRACMVSKTSYSHFFGQGLSYYSYTHAWTKLHNEVMSWIFGVYECHYARPLPEASSTTVCGLTVSSVSSLPLSIMVHRHIH